MKRLSRSGLSLGLAAFCCAALVSPALADSASVADPKGDVPDIVRLTLNNKQSVVVLKQKYSEIDEFQTETLYIEWGQSTYYRLQLGNFDEDKALEKYLWLHSSAGTVSKKCADMTAKRNYDLSITTFRVPRSCLPKAANRIKAKGVATLGTMAYDETKYTARVARG